MDRRLYAIDHVGQLTGSADYVGLENDIKRASASRRLPVAVDMNGDFWLPGAALPKRGFGKGEMDAILSGNTLRALCQSQAAP